MWRAYGARAKASRVERLAGLGVWLWAAPNDPSYVMAWSNRSSEVKKVNILRKVKKMLKNKIVFHATQSQIPNCTNPGPHPLIDIFYVSITYQYPTVAVA